MHLLIFWHSDSELYVCRGQGDFNFQTLKNRVCSLKLSGLENSSTCESSLLNVLVVLAFVSLPMSPAGHGPGTVANCDKITSHILPGPSARLGKRINRFGLL